MVHDEPQSAIRRLHNGADNTQAGPLREREFRTFLNLKIVRESAGHGLPDVVTGHSHEYDIAVNGDVFPGNRRQKCHTALPECLTYPRVMQSTIP